MSDEALKIYAEKYGKDSERYKRLKKLFESGEDIHQERYGDDDVYITGSVSSNSKKNLR